MRWFLFIFHFSASVRKNKSNKKKSGAACTFQMTDKNFDKFLKTLVRHLDPNPPHLLHLDSPWSFLAALSIVFIFIPKYDSFLFFLLLTLPFPFTFHPFFSMSSSSRCGVQERALLFLIARCTSVLGASSLP